jgi:hypothetical protein
MRWHFQSRIVAGDTPRNPAACSVSREVLFGVVIEANTHRGPAIPIIGENLFNCSGGQASHQSAHSRVMEPAPATVSGRRLGYAGDVWLGPQRTRVNIAVNVHSFLPYICNLRTSPARS